MPRDPQPIGMRIYTAYPGERLVVCNSPPSAKERGRKRDELLAATEPHEWLVKCQMYRPICHLY